MDKSNPIDFLRAENVRLIALLELHGIDWKAPLNSTLVQPVSKEADSTLSTDEKVAVVGSSPIRPTAISLYVSGMSGHAPEAAK